MIARPPTSPCGSAGFTVVEVLMALLVMTVGLLGLLQSLQVAYQHSARNKLREEAVQLAEEQMNQYRLIRYFDNLTANRVVTTESRSVAGAGRDFVITRDCQPLGVDADRCLPDQGDAKKLTVTVSWQFQNVPLQHVICTIKNR